MSTRDPDANLSPDQKILYSRIQKANDLLRQAKETAEERARQRIRDELAELEALRNHQVREAHALYEATKLTGSPRGLPTASIKRAMRTKDHVTVTKIWDDVDLTEYQTKPEVPMYELDFATMTGVLNWLDFEGERVEGRQEFVIHDAGYEDRDGQRYAPSYIPDLNTALGVAANDAPTYLAFAAQVDADVKKEKRR